MKTIKTLAGSLLIAALVSAAADDASAQSFGLYGMPSRFCQYLGCGYGAGHHAPIVRTPGQHPQRIPWHAQAPTGPMYAAPVAPIGCYGASCPWAAPPYPAVDGYGAAEVVPPPAPSTRAGQQPIP